jgi:hypothetical protein
MFAAAFFVLNLVTPIAIAKSEPVVRSGKNGNIIDVIVSPVPPPKMPGAGEGTGRDYAGLVRRVR